MLVWLKTGGSDIGVADGVVPLKAIATLKALDALKVEAEAEIQHSRQQMQESASEVLAQAREEASVVVADAHDQIEDAVRRGFEEGRSRAIQEWHDGNARAGLLLAQEHQHLRKKLAGIAVNAVAELAGVDGGDGYFKRALAILDRLAEDESALRVRVHPANLNAAAEAIEELRQRWGSQILVKLEPDDSLAPMSCICESAQGYIDASLSVHLAAIESSLTSVVLGDAEESL